MRFRKFIMGMLMATFGLGIFCINTYAANDEPVLDEPIFSNKTVTENDNVTAEEIITIQNTGTEIFEHLNDLREQKKEQAIKAQKAEKAAIVIEKAKKKEAQREIDKKYKENMRLLSSLIFCEANTESYQGKLAVAIIVLNRKESGRFPRSIKEVVYQRGQFVPAHSGALSRALNKYDKGRFATASEKDCIKAAKAALDGKETLSISGRKKDFSRFLFFSVKLRGYTFRLGNHQFK